MQTNVVEIYPPTGALREHRGLYLDQDLRELVETTDSAFVYANFIVSLDGRIAIPDSDGEGVRLATPITNDRDWHLFQELAVQADVLITSGRYMREYKAGPKQELLQVYDDPAFEHLGTWRKERDMSEYPAIAVISRNLDFDVPEPLKEHGRELIIFTTQHSNPDRRNLLHSQGAEVIISGDEDVTGEALVEGLHDLGHQLIYSTAGPRILHLLMSDRILDRLYLTIATRILGGDPYASILEGSLLVPPVDFDIRAMYFDPEGPGGAGQIYCSFDNRDESS